MTAEPSYLPGASERANEQVRVYEATGGAERWDNRGVPVVILSTRGRHSGAIRKMPLMRVTDGEKYAVIASLGGAPKHPVWYLNLQADPVVALQDKAVKWRYRAHTATGQERAEWWARAVSVWPDYAKYQTKTDREIPVVILEPLPDQD